MEKTTKNGIHRITQAGGKTIAWAEESGVKVLEKDGYYFKDLAKTGELLPYEDWRLSDEERAADLAGRLSIEEIAGLMLYSPHQAVPPMPGGPFQGTFDGKTYLESGKEPYAISDQQKEFLEDEHIRHILLTNVESPEISAKWSNELQKRAETLPYGIPVNLSSDPRNGAKDSGAEFKSGGSEISKWPEGVGFAACFDPEVAGQFAKDASREYRALGITTALGPQIDLCTEPRWMRFVDTLGENLEMTKKMVKAYCDGMQTTKNSENGWGYDSVNTMVKHWPGGGSGEGGRDAHYGNGKFAVYPGGCYEQHKIPFLEGAFKLTGGTEKASAVMPYYTISYNQTDENVGNGFNREIISHQLREEAGYDGVVCTDWIITGDEKHPGIHSGKPWGVETMSVAERHYKALMAGVDQFGGNNEKGPVIEAYEMGVKEHGEEWMRARFERSARRLLLNIFRTGLFENPYVDVERTKKVVGNPEFMQRGYEQQLKSVVMIKNHANLLPQKERKRVYIPQRRAPEGPTYWRNITPERIYDPVPEHVLEKYYDKAACADNADFAVVLIESPHSLWMGYDMKEGYIPISLQYADYTATTARKHSIAGGDPFEDSTNRSYRGKTAHTINACDLTLLQRVRKEMGNKPVVVVLMMSNPTVMREIEPLADAILVGFDVQAQVYMDLISGRREPSALLPVQLPESMEAVEEHCEDRPRDIRCYRDADGNVYDFAFGLNWSGVINDERVKRYK